MSKRERKPTTASHVQSRPLRRVRKEENKGETEVVIARSLNEEDVTEEKDPEKRWRRFGREYTNQKKKKFFAKYLLVGLDTVFCNNIFWYNNHMYLQKVGRAIGARLTGVVVRLMMDRGERQLLTSLRKAGEDIYLPEKYVDDVNVAVAMIKRGW